MRWRRLIPLAALAIVAAVAAGLVAGGPGRADGGPLAASTVGDQLESTITSCSPVTDRTNHTIYIGFASIGEPAGIPEDTEITGVTYEVSGEVLRHRPVVAVGEDVTPGYTMEAGPGNWLEGKIRYVDLPTSLRSDAGLGVLLEIKADGPVSPVRPVLVIDKLEYTSDDGSRYSLDVERSHWISRTAPGTEEYCAQA